MGNVVQQGVVLLLARLCIRDLQQTLQLESVRISSRTAVHVVAYKLASEGTKTEYRKNITTDDT